MESPFEQYKNEVKYDVIIEGTVPYKVQGVEDEPTPVEDQLIWGEEDLFKYIEDKLLKNEDYLYDCFKETGIARGRIYGEFSDKDVNDNKLYFKFGISKKEAEKNLDIKEIQEYFEDFLLNVGDDVEYASVTGLGTGDEDDDYEPTYVELKIVGKPEVNVLKNDLSKKQESFDKQLVYNGELYFRNNQNNIKHIVLTDEGNVNVYDIDNKLIESKMFSISTVNKLCEDIQNDGYNLDDMKQNLEATSDEIDELQTLKDEVEDKLDTLMNESKENVFPSTNITKEPLSYNSFNEIDLDNQLTNEQKQWLIKNVGTVDELKVALADLLLQFPNHNDPVISIDEYIEEVSK